VIEPLFSALVALLQGQKVKEAELASEMLLDVDLIVMVPVASLNAIYPVEDAMLGEWKSLSELDIYAVPDP
jgi:hypothetical protein